TLAASRGRVREAPSLTADIAFVLTRGETAVILDADADWYRIGLPDGRIGWAHKRLFVKKTPAGELRDIRVEHKSPHEERIIFSLSGVLIPTIFSLPGESMQLVCDFPNTLPAAELEKTITVNSSLIRHIGVHKDPQPKTLVVLDLVSGKDYEADQYFFEDGFTYILMLHPVPAESRAAAE
ncbi:MAG: SH3 domain-containing protein, partial [Deltaproteobacteria bacterium]|nr:SH3 domain-containing protein [Deltaproteobacteria bacterium]